MHTILQQIAMFLLVRVQVAGKSPSGSFAIPYKCWYSGLSPLNSVNVTCAPAAKSDLTEKLPFVERRGFSDFDRAICRVRCVVIHCTDGAGALA